MEPAPYGTFGPVGAAVPAFHALMPVALLWLLALLAAFPRSRTAIGAAALALGVRLAAGGPRPYMHADKAWYYMSEATGELTPDVRYGDGYGSLMGLLQPLTEGAGDHAFGVNLLLSSLTAGFVAGLAERVDGAKAGIAAGGIAALVPLSVLLGGSELPYVSVALLQVAGLYGVTGTRPAERLLAATSIVMLAHMRPLQLVTSAFLLVLWRGAPRAWLAAAAAGWLWRAGQLGLVLAAGETNTNGVALWLLPHWLQVWTWAGAQGRILLLDPWVSPAALAPLALWGALGAHERRPDVARGAVGLMLLQLALYGHQALWPDRVRFLSPMLPWAALLAGIGLLRMQRWWPAGAAALLVTGWLARDPLAPEGVWIAENRFLRAHIGLVRRGERVAFARTQDTVGVLRKWLIRSTDAFWEAATNEEPAGTLRFVGIGDRLPGALPVPWERLEPIAEIEAPPNEHGMVHLVGDGPVKIGLYRVVVGPEAAATLPGG